MTKLQVRELGEQWNLSSAAQGLQVGQRRKPFAGRVMNFPTRFADQVMNLSRREEYEDNDYSTGRTRVMILRWSLGSGHSDGRLSVAAAKALLCAVARKTAVFGGEALRGP